MLEIKDILMGADTDSPALNDYCRLVANRLPYRDVSTAEMAQMVLQLAFFDIKKIVTTEGAEYPNLSEYVNEGGSMRLLSAKIYPVLEEGARGSEVEPFVSAYKTESVRFFGDIE